MITGERFWSRVELGTVGECWPWQGASIKGGYGQLRFGGKHETAHRVAWILTNGPIGEGQQVLHRCDNPPCCNPDHLFPGTQLDNVRDMDAKGRRHIFRGDEHWSRHHPERIAHGEEHHNAKLTLRQVEEIRSRRKARETYQSIADSFGVSYTLIWNITNGRAWLKN